MLNIAIIGTGNISEAHIGSYLTFPQRCKIVALVDIYPDKATEKQDRHQLSDAVVYSSHRDILNNPAIDLVSICTPPFCHAEIAIDCLKARKHVIVEKPMASSLAECDAIIAAEQESCRKLSVIAQNRFRDQYMRLYQIVKSGKIGRILHAQVDSLWWRGHCYYDLWWRGCWEKEGGGCTLNHAVHHIDMLGWMLGMPKKVTALLSNATHDNAEVEDISIAALLYDQGTLAQITSSVIHHGEEQQIVFQGEDARISAPWKVAASTSMSNGFPQVNQALIDELNQLNSSLPSLQYCGHIGQIDNVLTAIETNNPPLVSGQQGRQAIELITAIYKAGTEGRIIDLPLAPTDPFYTVDGIMKNVPYFYKKNAAVLEQKGEITVGGLSGETHK